MKGKTATALKQNIEIIMEQWEARALAEVGSAATAATLALRNSIPIYLNHLSQALAENRRTDVKSVQIHDTESNRIGKLHGEDRAGTPSYNLAEVISEYHILREVIFSVLEPAEQLKQSERDIILDSIEQAVNDAAVKLSEVHSDIQNQFISTLTHDLKNPLTAAKINAQLILKRSDRPDDCLRSAGRIIGSINRVESMVHDLLDANQLRAGLKLSLQFIECDLTSIIRDVIDEFRDVQGRDISFNYPRPINGRYGADGIRRAAENLLGNALKYSPPNTPVQVSLSEENALVKISVHNLGPAISDHDHGILFQQYRRLKSAEESNIGGWGIGLTLVLGVAQAHGGTIEVISNNESGTTFTLSIPKRI